MAPRTSRPGRAGSAPGEAAAAGAQLEGRWKAREAKRLLYNAEGGEGRHVFAAFRIDLEGQEVWCERCRRAWPVRYFAKVMNRDEPAWRCLVPGG